ncbi:uncharacterized protein EI97DRAFT_239538 [Westerdykella ornata]|uniref:Uncharacterized protein n=1 Tax=Westerdykella ornata TaxID=318751 RepID=A0A6A6J8D1_WESOR|nr:uncharacterized protein EI97DRAFT_239538 [Westerdykella ornata]KAF2271896.1 hypothetical protein EI97DRAFT_239538 [Westerdykella ornata]
MAEPLEIPRRSRFQEGTMNSTTSIHPPPAEFRDFEGEDVDMRSSQNEPPTATTTSVTAPAQHQSIYSRFSRAAAFLFRGSTFAGLGKRKREERDVDGDERKQKAEHALAEARKLGLLPAPKVFVRPRAQARGVAIDPTTGTARLTRTVSSASVTAPGTPRPRSTPSKKDLERQERLRRKISNIEQELANTQRKLKEALDRTSYSASQPSSPAVGVKKRKISDDAENHDDVDSTYSSFSSDEAVQRSDSKRLKKSRSSRSTLRKRHMQHTPTEDIVTVVPDGVSVPQVPAIPEGVDGKRAEVVAASRKSDDGYGGLAHEIF